MARTNDGGIGCLSTARGCGAWLLLGLAACSSNDSMLMPGSAGEDDEGGSWSPGANNDSRGGNAGGLDSGADPIVELPDEQEVTVEFEAPQSSVNYVYATNPERDSVAVISAASLAIHVVDTGDQPRFLKTIPGRDAALLVDVGASDLAYIETVQGKSTVSYFRDLPSANAISVAPDGKHAVAYFDVSKLQQGKFETLQDVSVITFDPAGPRALRMTVGFKPRQVSFAGGGSDAGSAYIVTEDGVSILDFSKIDSQQKSAIADTVQVFNATEAQGEDISVTPDGRYAIGRIADGSTLRMVELATGTSHSLDLATLLVSNTADPIQATGGTSAGGASAVSTSEAIVGSAGDSNGQAGTAGAHWLSNSARGGTHAGTSASRSTLAQQPVEITDLDVSPDGKFALAVSRDRGVLLRVPIPGGFLDSTQVTQTKVEGVTIGAAAVSGNGRWAVLYTTVLTSERRIVIHDLTALAPDRVLDLTKSIKGIAFSSSGDQAYVVHNKGAGDRNESGLTPEQVLERSNGYTLVDLNKAFRKLVITDTEPMLSVTTPNAPFAFLSFQSASGSTFDRTIQRIDMDSLQVSPIQLGSVPISLGVVSAAGRVFVSQQYEDGRLTFIDWNTLETTTVTGYELNSKIRE